MENIETRESMPGDLAAIELLYPESFPDDDLLPLVRSLLQEEPAPLSLVGIIGSQLVGHIIYTECGVIGSNNKAALLGPLAVSPAWQRQGIGNTIVRAGLRQLEDVGIRHVYVLGDPAYYGRFGFLPESGVAPPYALPAEWNGAWQSKSLGGAAKPGQGELLLPEPWLQSVLWV